MKSTTSPALGLLLQSVRQDDEILAAGEAASIIKNSNIDWDDFLDEVRLHNLAPQLKYLFNNLTGLIPERVLEELELIIRLNLIRQLKLISEFLRIQEQLDKKETKAIPFKGFWLGHDLYNDIAARISGDLDLFINVKDIEEVKQIMAASGYEPEKVFTLLPDDYIIKEFAEYNFDLIVNGSSVSHFEFHWRIGSRLHDLNITLDDLEPHITFHDFQGKRLMTFDPSASFLLTLMHHGGKDQLTNLKHILDIALFLKSDEKLDWPWIISETKRHHMYKVLLVSVLLANEITKVTVPNCFVDDINIPAIKRLEKNRLNIMAIKPEKTNGIKYKISGWIYRIRSRDSLVVRLGFIRYLIGRIIFQKRIDLH